MAEFTSRFWKVVTYDVDDDYQSLHVDDDDVVCNVSPYVIKARLRSLRCYYSVILHDRDKNNDGTDKKPHYHWIVEFAARKSLLQVKELFGVNVAYPCRPDIALDYRYLLHLDSPSKYQYIIDDISTNLEMEQLRLRLTCDSVENTDKHLFNYVQLVASGALRYRDLYAVFPQMVYKANVVQCLVNQCKEDILIDNNNNNLESEN